MKHELFQELNIDDRNRFNAVEDANATRYDNINYRDFINRLGGNDTLIENDDYLRHTFLYMVEQQVVNGETDQDAAYGKAVTYVTKNPWSIVEPEYVSYYQRKSEVDALGNPKQKKGAKKEKAIQVFKELINGFGHARKDAIAILMDKVGLTSGAASTYYANLQSGRW